MGRLCSDYGWLLQQRSSVRRVSAAGDGFEMSAPDLTLPHPLASSAPTAPAARPRLFVVTQHFAPDETSTARYLTDIADALAVEFDVTVLSGTAAGPSVEGASEPGYRVVRMPTRPVEKGQLVRRLLAMVEFSWQSFNFLRRHARRGDRVVVVTTPLTLPYFVQAAASMRGARTFLILYDLYPDVLIASGLAGRWSPVVGVIKLANAWLYSRLERIVAIGDDMKRRIEASSRKSHGKITIIPNWVDIDNAEPPPADRNAVRARLPSSARFVVGLSGNLGFVHDPMTVLAAARRIKEPGIHFLLSGWGVGWDELVATCTADPVENATLVHKVPYEELTSLLAAADVWIIPYKANMEGVSVPSRFYNLLAMGKPIITLAEPDADHSRIISGEGVGWVVPPGDTTALVRVVEAAAADPGMLKAMGERARTLVARRFSRAAAGAAYRQLASGAKQDT